MDQCHGIAREGAESADCNVVQDHSGRGRASFSGRQITLKLVGRDRTLGSSRACQVDFQPAAALRPRIRCRDGIAQTSRVMRASRALRFDRAILWSADRALRLGASPVWLSPIQVAMSSIASATPNMPTKLRISQGRCAYAWIVDARNEKIGMPRFCEHACNKVCRYHW